MINHSEEREIEKQRKVINESYAVIRRQFINASLRTLLKLVEKKQCGKQ